MKTQLKRKDGGVLDARVFALKIHQKEGLRALCDIEIQNDVSDLPSYWEVWIDDVCQFKGMVTSVLGHYTPYTQKVELVAVTHNASPDKPIGGKARDVPQHLLSPGSRPQMHSDADTNYFSTSTEHLPHIHHHNRLDGALTSCHLIQATHTLIIPPARVLNYESTHHPVSIGVDLVVHAKWRWQRTDVFDLWAAIRSQCGGVFATLTPEAFIRNWDKAMNVQMQTGYRVLHNKLYSLRPRIVTLPNEKRIKGGEIDGQCLIEARQEQKCYEVAHETLGVDCAKRKRLVLHVPIDDHDEKVFFTTAKGQRWMDQARAIAHNHYLALNRQKRVVIEAVLMANEMAQLTMDTALNAGELHGKIINYTIENKGEGYVCRVTVCDTVITCHPRESGDPFPSRTKMGPRFRGDDTYMSDDTVGVVYIQDLHIMHTFDEQSALITAATDGSVRIPVTAVYLLLKDLRPSRL